MASPSPAIYSCPGTPTGDGFSLDLYHVLEDDGAPITDRDRQSEIERALWRSIQRSDDSPFEVSRRAPRQASTPEQSIQ